MTGGPVWPGDDPPPETPMTGAAATTGESTLTGGAWTSLAYGLPQIYVLVLSVVAARYLGPEGMGQQSFIAWASLSLAMLLTTGVASTLQRYVAEMLGRERPDRAMALLHSSLRVAFGLALLGGAALIAVGLSRSTLQSAWVLAGVGCTAAILHSVPHALLLGYQRFREATMAGLVTGAVGVVATIVVLSLGGGITGIFAVEACVSTAALIWLTVVGRRLVIRAPTRSQLGGLARPVLRYGAYSTLVGLLALVVERRSEFLALEAFSDADQIAFYSIAFGGVAALVRLVEGAAAPIVPVVATLFGAGDSERIASGVARAVRLMLLVSLPVAAAGIALGGPAIELVYGSEYSAAGPVLLVLVAVFPLLALFNLGGATLDGLGRIRLVVVGMVVASVVDIGLAVTLVPRLDAVGAAIANACAQATGALLLLLFLRTAIGKMDVRIHLLLPLLAVSVLAAAAAWFAGSALPTHTALLAAGPAFVAVFAVAALLVRPLPRGDADWISAAVGHRLGGRVGRTCAQFAGRR